VEGCGAEPGHGRAALTQPRHATRNGRLAAKASKSMNGDGLWGESQSTERVCAHGGCDHKQVLSSSERAHRGRGVSSRAKASAKIVRSAV
jgi:hypothetical protein